jgi:hypothetical protein
MKLTLLSLVSIAYGSRYGPSLQEEIVEREVPVVVDQLVDTEPLEEQEPLTTNAHDLYAMRHNSPTRTYIFYALTIPYEDTIPDFVYVASQGDHVVPVIEAFTTAYQERGFPRTCNLERLVYIDDTRSNYYVLSRDPPAAPLSEGDKVGINVENCAVYLPAMVWDTSGAISIEEDK